jgi:hypothetical protein
VAPAIPCMGTGRRRRAAARMTAPHCPRLLPLAMLTLDLSAMGLGRVRSRDRSCRSVTLAGSASRNPAYDLFYRSPVYAFPVRMSVCRAGSAERTRRLPMQGRELAWGGYVRHSAQAGHLRAMYLARTPKSV